MTLAEDKVNKQRQASNLKLAAAVFVGAMGKWLEDPEKTEMPGKSGKTQNGWKTRKDRNGWKIWKFQPTLNSRYASILA